MINIYDEKLNLKIKLNYKKEFFLTKPKEIYPAWNPNWHVSLEYHEDPRFIEIVDGEIKRKSDEVLKLEKIIDLGDGEYIKDKKLIVVPRPHDYVIWNENEWVLDEVRLEEKRASYFDINTNPTGKYRDSVLEKGTVFEDKKIIKGRNQDLNDMMGQRLKKVEWGEKVDWFFSSGEVERDVTLERLDEIGKAMGNFRSTQFLKEAEIKYKILQLTLEELVSFDLESAWND